jgi:hypothetical protein
MTAFPRSEHLKTLQAQALRLRALGKTDIEIARDLAVGVDFVVTELGLPPLGDRIVPANDSGFPSDVKD